MNNFLKQILEFKAPTGIGSNFLVRYSFQYKINSLEFLFEFLKSNNRLFYFSKPKDNIKFLAIDSIDSANQNEFIKNISIGNINSKLIIDANNNCQISEEVPIVLGAKKFTNNSKSQSWNDFENTKWFIPLVLLYQNPDTTIIVFQHIGSEPPVNLFEEVLNKIETSPSEKYNTPVNKKLINQTEINEWTSAVNSALNEIKKKQIEKVVLARRICMELESGFSIANSLLMLQDKYADCTTFAYKEGNSIFFGSTPEKLFSLKNNILETEALAGSIARGSNFEEDLINETNLINNRKELNEHNNVLQFILDNLKKYSSEISFSEKPQIKRLKNIQHLQTPIKIKLKNDTDILEILKALHPTPAVCGLPQKKALELIKDLEYFDRGLYAGVIGWFNHKKRAEFFVGIRSALLKENILTAFAGCGIVEGSDPVLEYNETELKLKPILSLLKNEISN